MNVMACSVTMTSRRPGRGRARVLRWALSYVLAAAAGVVLFFCAAAAWAYPQVALQIVAVLIPLAAFLMVKRREAKWRARAAAYDFDHYNGEVRARLGYNPKDERREPRRSDPV